jgi:hypothetical protein
MLVPECWHFSFFPREPSARRARNLSRLPFDIKKIIAAQMAKSTTRAEASVSAIKRNLSATIYID